MAKTLPMAYPLLNVGPEQGYVDQIPDQPALRSYFPETWLWELVPTGYTLNSYINIIVVNQDNSMKIVLSNNF